MACLGVCLRGVAVCGPGWLSTEINLAVELPRFVRGAMACIDITKYFLAPADNTGQPSAGTSADRPPSPVAADEPNCVREDCPLLRTTPRSDPDRRTLRPRM